MKLEEWKPLNMEVRSFVIMHVLRLEQCSSSLIKTILRVFKDDSKTLGNKSSALSFKSKIDLLYDLEEIEKEDYTHLLKLMEIRNQFAHNHTAVSFESLDEINPDINKYLTKYYPKDLPEDISREEKLKWTFTSIFEKVCGRLLVIEIEYIDGIQEEFDEYASNQVVKNIDEIWASALEKYREGKAKIAAVGLGQGSFTDDLEMFQLAFNVKVSEFRLKAIDGIKDKKEDVFKKKVPTNEKIKRIYAEEKGKSAGK